MQKIEMGELTYSARGWNGPKDPNLDDDDDDAVLAEYNKKFCSVCNVLE
jgi:hypothetical protein